MEGGGSQETRITLKAAEMRDFQRLARL